jgi:hypothetical protein
MIAMANTIPASGTPRLRAGWIPHHQLSATSGITALSPSPATPGRMKPTSRISPSARSGLLMSLLSHQQ